MKPSEAVEVAMSSRVVVLEAELQALRTGLASLQSAEQNGQHVMTALPRKAWTAARRRKMEAYYAKMRKARS